MERQRGRRRRLGAWVGAALAGGFLVGALASWEHILPRVRAEIGMRRVESQREVLAAASEESGVEACLLAAIMFCESSGRVSVRSSKGALGLFQLLPSTAAERAGALGLPAPSDEELLGDALLNARLGASYFAWLLEVHSGDVERALVAYNAGPTRLARWERDAGGWQAWRAERRASGRSSVLAYASRVLAWRERFHASGLCR